MNTIGWIILVVVILVIVAAVVFALMNNRRNQARREQANQLREEAAQTTASVDASQREAREAAARAEVARAEAERAEREAARAEQGVHYEQARVEDRVRTADSLDPDVDTRSADYQPTQPQPTTVSETGSGTTYVDNAEPTATDVTGRPLDTDPDDPAHVHRHTHRADPA